MVNKKNCNIKIPEELSISYFKERYSKMTLTEASSSLETELLNFDTKFRLMKHSNLYFDATNKLVVFMKEFSWLMCEKHRPASTKFNNFRYYELKSLLNQIYINSGNRMPKIQGDEDDDC